MNGEASGNSVPAAARAPMRVSIVHWSPLELYPPAQNLLRALESEARFRSSVHTTTDHLGQPAFSVPGIAVHRSPSPAGRGAVARVIAYLRFHFGAFLILLRRRPDAILYIEPSSAFPVWLHSLFRPRVPVFIHHHEYHSPDQFHRPGMRLIRWFHRLERRRLLPRAAWVSHTNARRMELFREDCPEVGESACRILPNHPPASWQGTVNTAWPAGTHPFRFVCAGSLSLRDTFLAEFVEWLRTRPAGSALLDVYAYNLDAETAAFLDDPDTISAGVRWIRGGVVYQKLPEVLRHYHAGLVLYRARTLNYRFNETNKLFEYLACGLDVWYPDVMEGIRPHAREDTTPRVVATDFTSMNASDVSRWMAPRTADELHPGSLATAEAAVQPLIEALLAVHENGA